MAEQPLPILILHGYIERYEKGHPELPDFSSRLVAQAAVEMIRNGFVREVLITTQCLDEQKISVADKMKAHIEEQLQKDGITTSIRVQAIPKANSTRKEVITARRYIRKLRREMRKSHSLEEVPPLLFMGISSHTERISRTVQRTFGRRALRNNLVSVEDAESVLFFASTTKNDYKTLLELEKKDIGRRAFDNRETRYNSKNRIPFLGRVATFIFQPAQRWLAPKMYHRELKKIEDEKGLKKEDSLTI